MNLARFAIAVFALFFTGTFPSRAERGTLMIVAHGECVRFVVSEANYACDKVLYAELPNGRLGYLFTVPGGTMALYGSKTSQPVPERYTLIVDKIATTFEGKNGGVDAPGKGTCVLNISADGKIFHALHCDVKGDVDHIVIDFLGDGRPVDAKRF